MTDGTASPRKRRLRRAAGIALGLAGLLFMWLAPNESLYGAALLAAGFALEAGGLFLEHRARRATKDSDALGR